MIFSASRRVFDNGIRDSGGIAQTRPSWETTATAYPIKSLPWSAYMDASDNARITLNTGTVETWRSSVVHPYAKSTIGLGIPAGLPFRFFLKSPNGSGGPAINGGTANPAGTQHISFDGTGNYFYSSAKSQASTRWAFATYSDTHGAGNNEGYWDAGTWQFIQPTAANVPNLSNYGPRFQSANSDYLYSAATLANVFTGGGSGGTITLAVYVDAQVAPSFGTNVAQTPYSNPAFISDSGNQFCIACTTSGVTLGAFDGVARDSGGGPGTNDGWQMVTAALSAGVDAIIQARWGSGTIMELRVLQASGWGAWQTAAFSDIASLTGILQLGENWNGASYYDGIIYEVSTVVSWLNDPTCDDEARYMAARVGIDIAIDNAIVNDAPALFGTSASDAYAHGFATFTVARFNSSTNPGAGVAYSSKSLWQASSYYIGLASETQSSVRKWVPNAFDGAGSLHVEVTETVADDTWALVSMNVNAGKLTARANGDSTTDTSATFAVANPYTYVNGQYLTMGYGIGSGLYLASAVAFFGVVPTLGLSAARQRDIERYLNATYMTAAAAAGTSYDSFGMLGFFGL